MRHYLADLTGSTEVLGTLTASNLMYPSSDGTNNQVIRTDGSGRLTFTSTVDSASHAEFADDAASAATATTASYVSSSNIDGDIEANSIAYSNITGVPAGLVSGSTQITALGFISESFSTAGTGILSGSAQIASEISGAFTADSASFSSSIASLETFSASLDATFATEAELNTATQSLSQSIAADIEDILDGTSTVPSASNAANATSASYIAVGNIDGDITADSVAYTNVTGIPAGIVSSSTQITAHGFISESFSTAGTGILSGSAQIASEISGAFTSTSSSLAATIEDIEDGTTTVPSASNASTASYVNASNIDGSITADSVAFTNVTGVPAGIVSSSAQTVANLPAGTVSGSAQITAHGFISESFSTAGTGILSGSAQIASEISGSLGANATLIRSLTAANISGSFNSVSASLASDIAGISDTDVDVNVSNLTTRLGQITGDVSVGGASSTVTIPGNLTVQGTRTELQVTQLNVEDTLITVASGAADSAAADGAGLEIAGANESITWNHANSRFNISDDLYVVGNVTLTGTVDGVDVAVQNTHLINVLAATSSFLTAAPAGTVSSSAQITAHGFISESFSTAGTNIVSSSAQTVANLPAGTVSGSAQITAHGFISSSAAFTTITNPFTGSFTGSFVGDGSRLTGITASIIPTTTVSESFSGVNTYTVNHSLESKEVIVQVYDSNDNVIVPSNIQVPTTESVILTFASNRSGRVVVARAGHVVSGSSSGGVTGGTGVTVSGGVVSIAQAVGTGDDLQFDSLGVGTAASGVTGEIRATNDVTAFYSSDERLKDNITPIQGSLDKVAQLGGYEFDWIPKEGIHSHEGHDIGVIAQEVEAVFPELVTTRDNGYKAVQYEKLTAVLLQAVKELTARVEELEKKQ